jgi:hypothetical protein
MTKRLVRIIAVITAILALGGTTAAVSYLPREAAAKKPKITVYKDPNCGCCKNWIKYLEEHGYQVDAKDSPDMTSIKHSLGVPDKLVSCHTGVVNGYLIEGHVSAEDVDRLLAQKPKIAGIAVPGMPAGSPGMGTAKSHYSVIAFDKNGKTSVFTTH